MQYTLYVADGKVLMSRDFLVRDFEQAMQMAERLLGVKSVLAKASSIDNYVLYPA